MTSKKSFTRSMVFTVFRMQLYSMRMVLILFGLILLVVPAMAVRICVPTEMVGAYAMKHMFLYFQQSAVFGGMVPLLVFAAVLAVSQFGYLHRRQRVDAVHAMPARRSALYLGRILVGLAAIACGALIAALGQTAVMSVKFAESQLQFYGAIWADFVLMLFSGFAVYLFAVLILVLTATHWEMIFSFLAVSAACPITLIFVDKLVSLSIPINDLLASMAGCFLLSPFFTGVGMMIDYGLDTAILAGALILLVQAAACGALGFRFFCRRPSELAENSAAKTRFKDVMRFLVAMEASFVGSMVLLFLTDTYAAYLLGGVLGAVLAWLGMELLYTHSLRTLKKAVLPGVGGLVVFAAVNLLVAFGLIGVPQVVPADEINAVSVCMWQQETSADGSSMTYEYAAAGDIGYTVYTEQDTHEVSVGCFDAAVVEKGRALAEMLLEDQRAEFYPYHPQQWESPTYRYSLTDVREYDIELTLYMEGGAKTLRYWNATGNGNADAICAKAVEILQDPAYMESYTSARLLDILESITYTDFENASNDLYIRIDDLPDKAAVLERLKAAYREDLSNATVTSTPLEERMYYLRVDSRQPVTLREGVVDRYYPAAGMTCWFVPQPDTEAFDVYYMYNEKRVELEINSNDAPNTMAVLDELRASIE